MSCKMYETYEMGGVEERVFRQHLETCTSCREQQEQDNRILAAARSLKDAPVDAPGLWERIELELLDEQVPEFKTTPGIFSRRFHVLIAATVLLAAVALGVYFGVFLSQRSPGLLSGSALNKVQQTEQQYMEAIAQLEKKVQPQMQEMDIELMLLYKDRLAVIDSQIRECKEALLQNPANSHIRRYMLAALQDKKETLSEMLRPNLKYNATVEKGDIQ